MTVTYDGEKFELPGTIIQKGYRTTPLYDETGKIFLGVRYELWITTEDLKDQKPTEKE